MKLTSPTSEERSAEFLRHGDQFKLGTLVTESSHPATAHLSDVAAEDIPKALGQLFAVDGDVLRKYREFIASGKPKDIRDVLGAALRKGGRVFFAGCGSTGRLSVQLVSIWRSFWQEQGRRGWCGSPGAAAWEERLLSVMSGGDFALVKSVEGFEDYAAFGRRQLEDLGVGPGDVVFAITEGGETSFVIGAAWGGLAAGAKVYFVYNNPDDILCQHVQRSREILEHPNVERINLTTGPMAITGSTRMQATTIQLCVLLTVLEMALRDILRGPNPSAPSAPDSSSVPSTFLTGLEEMHATLTSPALRARLAELVALEESVYRSRGRNNYYADQFGIDILTDTTERSPTYCTPPFGKFDDPLAAESWAFLFVPSATTEHAWERILKRRPQCIEWDEASVRELVGADRCQRVQDLLRKIRYPELLRFRIGLDGTADRRVGPGDSVVAILSGQELGMLQEADGFYGTALRTAMAAGARPGILCCASAEQGDGLESRLVSYLSTAPPNGGRGEAPVVVCVPVPTTGLLLDGVTRVGLKMVLNALSTCTMVRLGRVMGNYMVWVVASNLKLIDRATRYIEQLGGLSYERANRLLFEVVEYVEPRMKSDQAYPPVVAIAVLRARHGLTNEAAEQRLSREALAADRMAGRGP